MTIDEGTFVRTITHRNFQRGIDRSLIPFSLDERPRLAPDRKTAATALAHSISLGRYFPDPPRDYLTINKGHGLTRICPQFSYQDTCVYYYCIQQLVSIVGDMRVEGTFGGWRGSVPFRKKEVLEHNNDNDRIAALLTQSDYGSHTLFDPTGWAKEWIDFQKITYTKSRSHDYRYFLKVDIADFYDSINLNRLEDALRHHTERDFGPTIDLLFVLLRYWNRQIEGYAPKSVGIPQISAADDCSRVLANFYLYPYDYAIRRLTKEIPFDYVRYADDQVFMFKSKSDSDLVMNHAST